MKKHHLFENYSRRSVIKFLGLGASTPFLPVLHAEAADGNAPKRLLVMTTPSGLGKDYIPRVSGSTDVDTNAGTHLGPSFKALEPFKDKINIYRGLDFAGFGRATLDKNGNERTYFAPNSHPALAPHMLTAAWTIQTDPATGLPIEGSNSPTNNDQVAPFHSEGLSIDQYVAKRLMESPDTQTGLPFILAGVQSPDTQYSRQIYSNAYRHETPTINPNTLFNDVFFSASQGDSSQQDFDADRFLANGKSIIDYALEEIKAVEKLVSADDKSKMEAHINGIREYERRIADQAKAGSLECSIPDIEKVDEARIESLLADQKDETLLKRFGDNIMDIMVAGLACDRSRVGTIMWGGAAQNTVFKSLGLDQVHHSYTHPVTAFNLSAIEKISGWFAERFYDLIDRMSKIPEGNGTLLDNTLILWVSEHSNENTGKEHERTNIPCITAGSCGGAINTGRLFDYSSSRRGHGDMYATAAQAMGFSDVNTFGFDIVDLDQGPLPGVLT